MRAINSAYDKPHHYIYIYIFITHNIGCFKQDDTLWGDLASVDVATKENLDNLVKVGEQLLKKTFTRVNLDTGLYEPVQDKGTNEQELKRFI